MEHINGSKPSTLDVYHYFLTPPDEPARKRGRRHADGRVLREFGGRKLHTITAEQVERWLVGLAELGLSNRTVNTYRQMLCSVLGYAADDPNRYGISENVAAATRKRREPAPAALDFYEPVEIQRLVDAARTGAHWSQRPANSPEARHRRRAANQRDAALYALAAYAGLRLGELLALRWFDVSLERATVIVNRASSAGVVTSPKSDHSRAVPLAAAAACELRELRHQCPHTPDDLVFCRMDGAPLSPSGVRKRYLHTRAAAKLRPLRFHDLRHSFGSLAVREVDTVTLKDWMGHAKLATTERYLHAKPRLDDAARLDRAFVAHDPDLAARHQAHDQIDRASDQCPDYRIPEFRPRP
jgi:integrase